MNKFNKVKTLNLEKGVSLIITFFTAIYIFLVGRVRALNKFNKVKTLNLEKGVSLIITFFIMIIILTVVLSISVILYSEVKVMRNVGNSIVSYYTAESGIEKVLYYDKQVLPVANECEDNSDCTTLPYTSCNNGICMIPSSRGLCGMTQSTTYTPKYCANEGQSSETSIYCLDSTQRQTSLDSGLGVDLFDSGFGITGTCSLNDCTDCKITFKTTFDSKRKYEISTTINPDGDFYIESTGKFGDTQRKIQTLISEGAQGGGQHTESIEAPCSNLGQFISDDPGPIIDTAGRVLYYNNKIDISANILYQEGITVSRVEANIYKYIDSACYFVDSVDLTSYGLNFSHNWMGAEDRTSYYILLNAIEDGQPRHGYLWLDLVTTH